MKTIKAIVLGALLAVSSSIYSGELQPDILVSLFYRVAHDSTVLVADLRCGEEIAFTRRFEIVDHDVKAAKDCMYDWAVRKLDECQLSLSPK